MFFILSRFRTVEIARRLRPQLVEHFFFFYGFHRPHRFATTTLCCPNDEYPSVFQCIVHIHVCLMCLVDKWVSEWVICWYHFGASNGQDYLRALAVESYHFGFVQQTRTFFGHSVMWIVWCEYICLKFLEFCFMGMQNSQLNLWHTGVSYTLQNPL